jgi:deoxyribodipyrimidine photo-lyase
LRTHDHAALSAALQQCQQVHCVFVFDQDILDSLPRVDRRVEFIRESLVEVDASLRTLAGHPDAGLLVLHGSAQTEIAPLAATLGANAVYAAQDYEPRALARDAAVHAELQKQGRTLHLFKDHVVFEQQEILTQMGKPYSVYTPYARAWRMRLGNAPLATHAVEPFASALAPRPPSYDKPVPTLQAIGFEPSNLRELKIPTGMQGAQQLLEDFWSRLDGYDETRNYPAVKGPSYLGVHLRFGTASIRQLVNLAMQRQVSGSTGASTWLGELIWRDFYFQILANFPHVDGHAFKPAYEQIAWDTSDQALHHFEAWCRGATGYPLVDAAMLQLNHSGYMHNRLRMVAGSFLVKHLGIDWRWGERYFAEKLNDFDLASNNGGWQWVSSSGCDAQPYFRIFNPVSQSEKFDAEGSFIRRYLPCLAQLPARAIHAPWLARPIDLESAAIVLGRDYPRPIVDHAQARAETLARYSAVRKDSLE